MDVSPPPEGGSVGGRLRAQLEHAIAQEPPVPVPACIHPAVEFTAVNDVHRCLACGREVRLDLRERRFVDLKPARAVALAAEPAAPVTQPDSSCARAPEADGLTNWERSVQADLAMLSVIEGEIAQLEERKTTLRTRLTEALEHHEEKTYRCAIGQITLADGASRLKVVDEKLVPAMFVSLKPVIDNDKLKAALKLGAVPGAKMETGKPSLRVTFA